MATILNTQEFLAEHKNHATSVSILELSDARYIAEIQKLNNGHLYAVIGEKDSEEHVENTGAYLYCHNCQVEGEINLGEVIED